GPRRNTGVLGVVECILRRTGGDGVLTAVEAGVAEVDGVHARRGPADAGFDAAEVQVLNVERAIDVGGRRAGESDAVAVRAREGGGVALAALEEGEVGAGVRGGEPIEAGLVGPGAFGAEAGAADVAGVVIVKVGVAGNAEGAAC